MRLASVQLRDVKTKQAFIERLRSFAAKQPAGAWITGGDWDHENWGGELPTRQWIDAATPKNPVWINRLDGHLALANTLALKEVGLGRNTRELPGGTIVHDAQGEPTGILKDNAMEFVESVVPAPKPEAKAEALRTAGAYLSQFGVTSVHDMSANDDIDIIKSHASARQAQVRVYAAMSLANRRNLNNMVGREGRGDRWVRIGLLKGFVDGSLGSRTAAIEADYAHAPGARGLIVTPPEQLTEGIITSYSWGLQVAIHAIGDRANSLLLDVYARAGQVVGPGAQRARIEHAQHLKPADIERFPRYGIIASMQPYHLADDGRWAEKALGTERAKNSCQFRSLIDGGVTLAFGSDWFVAPPNVMEGIHAAVTRQTLDGRHPNGWVPEQKITVYEALKAYTYGGAYAAMEESYKGTLKTGMLADFVMLDRDILKIAPAEIRNAKVLLTVLSGASVYERKP
ncbi:MAG: amidohydrolase [Acidobacteria bacterium]|nr:amidohydrolase [Acidobacteriota bacterium]